MALTVNEANALLIEQMRLAMDAACELAERGEVPSHEVPVLERIGGEALIEGLPETEPDWQTLFPALTRGDAFWSHLAGVAEQLRDAELIEDTVGFQQRAEQRAVVLWTQVIAQLVHVYMLRRPGNFDWDEDEAQRVVKLWRDSAPPNEIEYEALAPLHNLVKWGEPVEVQDGLVIRELTDDERRGLWRTFGGPQRHSLIAPSVWDLQRWSTVVALRWKRPAAPPLRPEDVDEITERFEQVVTAQRLRHMGVVGITVVWVHPIPTEVAIFANDREMLYARDVSTGFEDLLASSLGPNDGESLRELMEKLAAVSDKKMALALRRFNSSYVRKDVADVLVDLWVAIEALLLPDGSTELSYRASLRLARAAGADEAARRAAFDHARESYNVRSKLVHGDDVDAEKVKRTVTETRNLLRQALTKWLLDPPADGVKNLDHMLLL